MANWKYSSSYHKNNNGRNEYIYNRRPILKMKYRNKRKARRISKIGLFFNSMFK